MRKVETISGWAWQEPDGSMAEGEGVEAEESDCYDVPVVVMRRADWELIKGVMRAVCANAERIADIDDAAALMVLDTERDLIRAWRAFEEGGEHA